MAKTRHLLIRYIMTRIFRKTFKNEFKETTRYDFAPFKENKCIDKKFTFKSKIFCRKIKAYHHTNDIKVTSITLDFLMANKTQLCMRNIATNVLTIMTDMSNRRVCLMEFEDRPYETDCIADCIVLKHEDQICLGNKITRDISIHIKPRPTITTKRNCYLFVNQNE